MSDRHPFAGDADSGAKGDPDSYLCAPSEGKVQADSNGSQANGAETEYAADAQTSADGRSDTSEPAPVESREQRLIQAARAQMHSVASSGDSGEDFDQSASAGAAATTQMHDPDATRTSELSSDPPTARATIFAGLRLEDLLGDGGQGNVYLAEELSPPYRRVALKLMRGRAAMRNEAVERFRLGLEMAGKLRHENIVRILRGDVTSDGTAYYVMEYVEGEQLANYVARHQLGTEGILSLFLPILDAIEHAHQRKVLHRDLKPQNILVGADGRPCIVDFDLARPVEVAPDGRMTATGQEVGTPRYMSPEQVDVREHACDLDARTDVYSLGVVLYELLTSAEPYPPSRTQAELRQHILSTPPIRPRAAARKMRAKLRKRAGEAKGHKAQPPPRRAGSPDKPMDQAAHAGSGARGEALRSADAHDPKNSLRLVPQAIPREVETILLKALEKDPGRRYESAAAFREDIERYLGHRPIRARRPGPLYKLRTKVRWWAVNRPKSTAVGIVILSVLLAHMPGFPLIYGLTPLGRAYQTAAHSYIGVPRRSAPLARTRVILLPPLESMHSVERELGFPDTDTSPTYRRVMASLIDRLSRTQVRAIATHADLSMANADEEVDERLAMAIRAFRGTGRDIIVGTDKYTCPHAPNQRFESHVLAGPVYVDNGRQDTVPLYLAIQYPHENVQPSFVLLAVSAARYPGADPQFTLDEKRGNLRIDYFARPSQSARSQTYHGTDIITPLRFKSDSPAVLEHTANDDRRAQIAVMDLIRPQSEAIDSVTRPLREIMKFTDPELAEWTQGAIVYFTQYSHTDTESTRAGRRGLIATVDHIVSKLDDRDMSGSGVVRTPNSLEMLAITTAAGLIGVCVPIMLGFRRMLSAAGLVTIVGIAVGGSLVLFRSTAYLCDPLIPLWAASAGWLCSLLVFARRRLAL